MHAPTALMTDREVQQKFTDLLLENADSVCSYFESAITQLAPWELEHKRVVRILATSDNLIRMAKKSPAQTARFGLFLANQIPLGQGERADLLLLLTSPALMGTFAKRGIMPFISFTRQIVESVKNMPEPYQQAIARNMVQSDNLALLADAPMIKEVSLSFPRESPYAAIRYLNIVAGIAGDSDAVRNAFITEVVTQKHLEAVAAHNPQEVSRLMNDMMSHQDEAGKAALIEAYDTQKIFLTMTRCKGTRHNISTALYFANDLIEAMPEGDRRNTLAGQFTEPKILALVTKRDRDAGDVSMFMQRTLKNSEPEGFTQYPLDPHLRILISQEDKTPWFFAVDGNCPYFGKADYMAKKFSVSFMQKMVLVPLHIALEQLAEHLNNGNTTGEAFNAIAGSIYAAAQTIAKAITVTVSPEEMRLLGHDKRALKI